MPNESLQAKIRVVSTETGQIADVTPAQFKEPDIQQIAAITNQVISQLQDTLQTTEPKKTSTSLSLSEIELTFGIDLEVEIGSELKIPLIGPVIRGGVRGGATFEVHIKLSRENS